jgi:beta-galactosidase GanA
LPGFKKTSIPFLKVDVTIAWHPFLFWLTPSRFSLCWHSHYKMAILIVAALVKEMQTVALARDFKRLHAVGIFTAAFLFLCRVGCSQELKVGMTSSPQLRKVGHVTQLFVGDQPFLALGGELGNSTASDLATLDAAMEKCQGMNLNTIMLPVYWDLIEPQEGKFDFSLVQGAIDHARQHNLRLVYLWFGTWKNSMSCYVPSWVKRDTNRFQRVRTSSGEVQEIISPLCAAANDTDAKAFWSLMHWTKQYDSDKQTVIMVQVENEIGMIPEPRDYSEEAEAAYRGQVPDQLLSLASAGKLGSEVGALWENAGRKNKGSWSEVFGKAAQGQEVFSAWQFASYVEKVAAAGKREYPLPMFTNAALIRPGYQPGQYPSAGPLPHLLEVWRAGAPSLDMICPDIYFPNFMEWIGKYVRNGNPLFIPEMADSMRAPGNAVYAAAQFGAIGFGPFSIENLQDEKARLVTNCYEVMSGMSGLILKAQQDGTIVGLSPQVGFDWTVDDQPQRAQLGGVNFEAHFDRPSVGGSSQTTTLPTLGSGRWDAPPGTPCGSAMILQLGPEEFAIVGMGVVVTFAPTDGKGKIGIDHVQEGHFEKDGTWIGGRWLNGDETHQGRHIHLYDGRWTVQRVTLYRY